MFTSLTIQSLTKRIAPNNATRLALNTKPLALLRCYSKKPGDQFQTEAEDILREAKNVPSTGVDWSSAIKLEGEELKAQQKEFYTKLVNSGQPVKDPYPHEFYDLSENAQKVIKDYKTKQQAAITPIFEKHGQELTPGLARLTAIHEALSAKKEEPVRVAITGAAGAIGYALAFRIASGGLFGPKTPVILQLLELPQALKALQGVEMELLDCAFPTLSKIVITDSPDKAFDGVDYALLVGASPRTQGMERSDLLLKNAEIFATQGKSLSTNAKGANTRVVVVGNPANTNALIASHHAKTIPPENFVAMTRLDHNRGLGKLAEKAKAHVEDISRFIIWGNHSTTQFPDISHALINNELAVDIINDDNWLRNTFIPGVQQRGGEIIKARGASSAASAASSCLDTVFDWHYGTHAQWMSAAVHSNGEYGVTRGLFYSYPVVFNDKRQWDIVRDLPIDQFAAEKMEVTHKELISERDGVTKFLS